MLKPALLLGEHGLVSASTGRDDKVLGTVTCVAHQQACLHTMAVELDCIKGALCPAHSASDLGLCRLSSGRLWPETRRQQQRMQLSRQLLQSASCSRWRHRAAWQMRPLQLCRLTGQHAAGALLCQPSAHALWRAASIKLPCSCISGATRRQQCTLCC